MKGSSAELHKYTYPQKDATIFVLKNKNSTYLHISIETKLKGLLLVNNNTNVTEITNHFYHRNFLTLLQLNFM